MNAGAQRPPGALPQRRFRQGLRLPKLPHHKTLDDCDFSFQPELDPRKVKDLAALSFVELRPFDGWGSTRLGQRGSHRLSGSLPARGRALGDAQTAPRRRSFSLFVFYATRSVVITPSSPSAS